MCIKIMKNQYFDKSIISSIVHVLLHYLLHLWFVFVDLLISLFN